MSKPDAECGQAQSAPLSAESPALMSGATRIDPPHVVAGKAEAASAASASAVKSPLPKEASAERMHKQAEQLAGHLSERQAAIDHREAELNARLAQVDRDLRSARLWLTERESELRERQKVAAQQQQEAQRRLDRLATAEAALEHRAKVADATAAEIDQSHSKDEPNLRAREEALCCTAESLEARQRQLEEAEARAAEAYSQIDELRRQLVEDRRAAEEAAFQQRQRHEAEQRRALEELEQKREAVQRRNDHVDQCRQAVEQLRADLGQMHRETLEIRLATEELWVQLSGAAPSAALTHSLGRIRSKLADHYRMSNAELQEQKALLEQIRSQLSAQYDRLVEQRRQFERWAAVRGDETEQYAARLIAREEQLDKREAELKDRAQRWNVERLEYQREIRQLTARLSQQAEVAVLA